MKEIKSMNFSELYKEFGLNLDMKNFDEILANPELISVFYQELREYRAKNPGREKNFIIGFLNQNSRYINQEAYVFFILKTLLAGSSVINSSQYLGVIEKCKKALLNSNFVHYEIDYSSTEPGNEIKRVTARELATGRPPKERRNKNKIRIEKIEEEIELADLFTFASSEDMLKHFGKNKILSDYIFKLGMINTLGTVVDIPYQKRLELLEDDNTELHTIFEENMSKVKQTNLQATLFNSIPIYLKKFPEEFDLDLILLIAAYRANYYLENVKLTPEQAKKYVRVLQVAKKHIESRSIGINDFPCEVNREQRDTYEYKDIINACSRITAQGEYLTTRDEEIMRCTALSIPGSITQMNPEDVRVIRFGIGEYVQMIATQEGTLAYLAHNNLISNKDLNVVLETVSIKQSDFAALLEESLVNSEQFEQYMQRQDSIDPRLFSIINNKKMVTIEEVLKLYIQGKIDITSLTDMPDEDKSELMALLSPQTVAQLYRDEQRQDEYAKYVNAFRVFILADKEKEEKDKIGEEIINELDLDMNDDDLVRLYQEHLISLDVVESWGGAPLITEMMKKAILKPTDVKEICKNGNYSVLFDIMKDRAIPRKNKLAIFYTTFVDTDEDLTEEQQEAKERAKKICLKHMRFSDRATKIARARGTITRKDGLSETTEKRKEYVSDPLNRWALLNLLDSEYSYEILDQGMMIFYLPNINGGTVILEKMFKKDQPDYGRATKVLKISIEEFEKVKPELIFNGDIPVAAVDSHPGLNGIVDSYWHTSSWGQKLADGLGYRTDARRSLENIEKIDREIDRVKKSRKLRE